MDGPFTRFPAATRLLLASLALLAIWPDAAAAACLDDVKALAAERGISTDPPTVTPGSGGGGPTPEQMARSGGVIEPPPVRDRSVVTPPPAAGAAMPTLPDITPGPPREAVATDRATLQALLVAARAQAERGNESGCLTGLAKARELAGKKSN